MDKNIHLACTQLSRTLNAQHDLNLELAFKCTYPCVIVHFVHIFYFSSQLVSRNGGVSTSELVTESIMHEGLQTHTHTHTHTLYIYIYIYMDPMEENEACIVIGYNSDSVAKTYIIIYEDM